MKENINIPGFLAYKMIVLSVVIVMSVTEIYRNRLMSYIAILKYLIWNGSSAGIKCSLSGFIFQVTHPKSEKCFTVVCLQ